METENVTRNWLGTQGRPLLFIAPLMVAVPGCQSRDFERLQSGSREQNWNAGDSTQGLKKMAGIDVSGKKPAKASRGAQGSSAVCTSFPAGRGGSGEQGFRGQNGGKISAFLSYVGEESFVMQGTKNKPGSTVDLEFNETYPLKPRDGREARFEGYIPLDVRGSQGGEGGDGGPGGSSATCTVSVPCVDSEQTGCTAPKTLWSGSRGNPGAGGSGGNGGIVEINVAPEETELLWTVKPLIEGGEPGESGSGSGGARGNSPVQKGAPGKTIIKVGEKTYEKPFQWNPVDIKLNEQIPDGFLENKEEFSVQHIMLQNDGGMPTPALDVEIELFPKDYIERSAGKPQKVVLSKSDALQPGAKPSELKFPEAARYKIVERDEYISDDKGFPISRFDLYIKLKQLISAVKPAYRFNVGHPVCL